MMGLEKNRVFDSEKLQALRTGGENLFSAGISACEEWDRQVDRLIRISDFVPAEIRSVTLWEALAGVSATFNKPEYETIKLQLSHTLGKLADNMPACDTEAASVLQYLTVTTECLIAMVLDMESLLSNLKADVSLESYQASLQDYDSRWDELQSTLSVEMDSVYVALKGLSEYTAYYGDPVNMSTGNFIYSYTDLEMGINSMFTFTRFYNAIDKNKCALGRGWVHNWEMSLCIKEDGIVLLHEDGKEEKFCFSEQGEDIIFKSCEDDRNLILQSGDYYYYLDPVDNMRAFDSQGRFIRFHSAEGLKAGLIYEEEKLTGIQADTGEAIYLFYNEKGQLVKLEDHTGRSVHFDYDKKKLTKVTDPIGNSYVYEYGKNGRITQIFDKRGVSVLKNEYDDKKRIISQEFPDGGIMKFDYLDMMRRVVVTEQNGNRITYVHDNKFRNIETGYEDGKETWRYDENNRCKSYTDKNGNTTSYEYNHKGQITQRTDALSNKTTAEYDGDGRLLKLVQPGGGVISRTYDEEGRLTGISNPENREIIFSYHEKEIHPESIILPDESRMKLAYDRRGNIKAIEYPDGTSMSYLYDDLNRVIESRDGNGNRMRFAYDAMNRIIGVIRPDGAQRSYRYNEMGEALEITDFDGYTAAWEYNVLSKPGSYTDKCGRKTLMEYDLMWNLCRVTDPEGGETDYVYNRLNRLSEVTDIGRRTVKFTYDANGNCTSIRYPDGSEMTYEYDALNRRTAVTDQNGNTTRTFYDAEGNVCRVQDALGNETVYEYDKAGNRIKETDAAGGVTRYTYTALGKPETIENPEGKMTRYSYGPGGRLLRKDNGDGTFEAYEYDKAGNITKKSYQDGSSISYRYDCLNRVTEIFRGEIREKAYEYDAMGNVLSAEDAFGNHTQYHYSPEGKLLRVIDAMGNEARYSYNGRDEMTGICRLSKEEACLIDEELQDIEKLQDTGHPLHLTLFERNRAGEIEKVTDEAGKSTLYRYDGMGRVSAMTNPEGEETTYGYYRDGRLKETRYPDGRSVELSYDALYHLSLVKDWLGETAFAYDAMGRMTASTDHHGEKAEYGFHGDGTRSYMKYPDGREVRYGYDESRRIREITSGDFRVDYTYDGLGRLARMGRGNGVESLYRYDGEGRLSGLVHQNGEGILEAFDYGYDIMGNRTGERRSSSQEGYSYERSYTYDALCRLTEVRENGETVRRYGYDAYGERAGQDAGSEESGISFVVNGPGQLTAVYRNGEPCQENTYNGLGVRVSVKQAEEGYDLSVSEQYTDYTGSYRRVIMERGKSRRSYLWQDESLLGMPGEESYVLTDALQTPVCVTDRSGSMENVYLYDEYGIPGKQKEASALPFGYTGYHKESVEGLYHVNAREYDSRKGRFLTKDAYRYLDERDPASFNLYLYAKGNPLSYRDYDGHECIEEKSYWERTVNHVVQGSYTEDITLLGFGIDVAIGLAGWDLPMDLRDLSADFTVNFEPTKLSWWATTAIDVLAVVPVIGAVKYVDDLGALGKNALKGMSKGVDKFKGAFKRAGNFLDGMSSGFRVALKNKDEALKSLKKTMGDSRKKLKKLLKMEVVDDAVAAARKKQKAVIESVENSAEGSKGLTTLQKGNYGEMKMDDYFESQGYKRLGAEENRVTDLNEPTHQGIDGVYYNPNGHPPYIIGEAKYGSSKLSKTRDGKQMSEPWIKGSNRLVNAVGKETADDILLEGYGKKLVNIAPDGTISIVELSE